MWLHNKKIPQATMLAIVETITFILNFVVLVCVMNHSRG